jgi:phosphohistidine phosphatase SixA
MKLYILRHGEAAEHGDPRYKETDRPLVEKGVQRTQQLARFLREKDITFDRIFSSPLTRAWQTAEIVGEKMRKAVERTDALAPDGNMRSLVESIDAIRPVPDAILLVGHEPYLSGLISLLCIGGPDLPIRLKKGSLVRLETKQLICGRCATLEWLLTPRLTA